MPEQIEMTFKKMRELHDYAINHGTILDWAQVALQWMEKASDEISKLSETVKGLTVSHETKEE